MKIAVDAFPLTLENPTGIANYVTRMTRSLLQEDTEGDYSLYARSPFEFSSEGSPTVECSGSASSPSSSLINTLWLFTAGVSRMKSQGTDIFFGTRQMMPPGLKDMARVLIVYDLVWHYYPETMSTYNALVLKLLGKSSINRAHRIISVSDATTEAITAVTRYPADRITTVYPSADMYTPLDRDESAKYIVDKYGVNSKSAVCVGTVEPRKNIKTLLRAFARLRGKGYQLLICGARGWKSSPILDEYKALGLTEDEVRFMGYVPDEDMNRLYSGARLFALSSIYEGFAMPPLEAMASGAPCVLSHPCISRIAGDAAELLDPHDIDAWAETIEAVMNDEARQERMRQEGLLRAGKLTWPRAAAKTLGIFRAAMNDVARS